MGGRSVSADRRRAVAAALCAAIAVAACSATSPPPLPPRRVDFPAQAPPPEGTEPSMPRPADLPVAAEAPDRDERYLGWTLAADFLSLVPLVTWGFQPRKVYLAAPALLLVPAIHAAHGESRSAGLSLLMRSAMLGVVYLTDRWINAECNAPSGSQEAVCFPFVPLYLGTTAIVLTMVTDSFILARRTRPEPGWDHLPLVGAAAGPDGRRLLTLSARF